MVTLKRLPLALAITVPLTASAGVETLTQEEMVDTYIKDSAIIVVPRQLTPEERQQLMEREKEKVIQTLTISPGEPEVSEAEAASIRNRIQHSQSISFEAAEELAEEQLIRATLTSPLDDLASLQPVPELRPALQPLVYGRQPQIPDAPFTETYLNNQLGLNFDGQNLTFSIGNPPGINQINIPQAINEGPIQIAPRPGGGFDLTIAVPDAPR